LTMFFFILWNWIMEIIELTELFLLRSEVELIVIEASEWVWFLKIVVDIRWQLEEEFRRFFQEFFSLMNDVLPLINRNILLEKFIECIDLWKEYQWFFDIEVKISIEYELLEEVI